MFRGSQLGGAGDDVTCGRVGTSRMGGIGRGVVAGAIVVVGAVVGPTDGGTVQTEMGTELKQQQSISKMLTRYTMTYV